LIELSHHVSQNVLYFVVTLVLRAVTVAVGTVEEEESVVAVAVGMVEEEESAEEVAGMVEEEESAGVLAVAEYVQLEYESSCRGE
jgi:hypothetical protein